METQTQWGYQPEHEQFRQSVRTFIAKEVAPHYQRWEDAGQIDRSLFLAAGKQGLLGFSVPEEFGGPGVDDFRYNAIVNFELSYAAMAGVAIAFALQNDVVLPYFTELTNQEQKRRWLAGIVSGEKILAIAMTEPDTGSDLAGIRTTAVRDGDYYLLDGAKTFISNGQNADLFVVAVRTSPDPHRGLSLLVVEADTPGFSRGRNLDKIGLHSQDTSELSFVAARVPVANLLGEENTGFFQLVGNLPQERLSLAIGAIGASEGTLARTLDYVKTRTAFNTPIGSFQNSRFVLAELATAVDVTRTYIQDCLREHLSGSLSAVRAARAKLWATEEQVRVADRCLQLHGGYGYMREYPVSRAYVDARIQTIYGGTSEIMKEIIGRDLGL